jgi:TrpR-related protein YerC/YecD
MREKDLFYEFDDILTIMSKMDSKDRLFDFFLDLLSENEMLEFAKRLKVAKMLDLGLSYDRIEQKTNMSSRTIAKISK